MKIAFITNDGETISRHFGRAPYYLVVTIEDDEVTEREMRDKLGHNHFSQQEHHESHGQGSGMDASSHHKHNQMAQAIQDCSALICGGMGRGAYQSMQTFGITPIVTEIGSIDAALKAYLKGELTDQTEMLH
jgi:predicted Fe-Mo cluster-binding NifX family protein